MARFSVVSSKLGEIHESENGSAAAELFDHRLGQAMPDEEITLYMDGDVIDYSCRKNTTQN